MNKIEKNVKRVKESSLLLSSFSNEIRQELLFRLAKGLEERKEYLFSENKKDIEMAKMAGIKESVLHRLYFTEEKLESCISGLEQLATLPDPLNKTLEKRELDDGLILEKVTVPIGVIGMIFEARPDAMIQIIGLSIRTGNGIILKGGKEARHSNEAILRVVQETLDGAPYIMLLSTHEDVDAILKMDKDIDLLIPRGSNAFVRYVMDNTHIPVLGHADGICSIYVDKDVDIEKAVPVVFDSKTQYPAACNAAETLIVHDAIAPTFLPVMVQKFKENGVEMVGDEKVCSIVDIPQGKEEDFHKEFLDLKIAIMIVSSIDEAICHINTYGSHHTDAIMTEDKIARDRFFRFVDSADVFCNASTRFADGFRFGLGAEVGISTSKIHARGPVGLSGLTTTKWLLFGNGDIVATYSGKDARQFKHKDLLNA